MKNKKRSIIFFVLTLAIIIVVSLFIFQPKNDTSNEPIFIETKYDKALKEVCLENYSRKFDGVYEFKLISNISFSSEISDQKIEEIYKQYGVLNAQDFKFAIFEEKQNEFKDTIIVLRNGNYTKNKNNIPIEDGLYFGNEDYSEIRIKINNTYTPVYIISLTGQPIENLKSSIYTDEPIVTNGQKLYLYEKNYDENNKHIYTICYIFNLVA